MEYKLTAALRKWLKTIGFTPATGQTSVVLFGITPPAKYKPVRTWDLLYAAAK